MMEEKKNNDFLQNRELSWLKFNERVLEEAEWEGFPLLDRFRFLSIFTSNLDEFFMVRVGFLTDCLHFMPKYIDNKTGMNAKEEIKKICQAVEPLYKKRDIILDRLEHQLAKKAIKHISTDSLGKQEKKNCERYFLKKILPLLSPQIIDPRHPFPHLSNKQLYIVVSLKNSSGSNAKRIYGLIPLPSSVKRLYFTGGKQLRYLLAEDILLDYADLIFDRYTIESKAIISVTRSADIDPDSDAVEEESDYRQHMKKILKKRQRLAPVRLEVQGTLSAHMLHFFCEKLQIKQNHVFYSKTPLDLSYCFALEKQLSQEQRTALLLPDFRPAPAKSVDMGKSILEQVMQKDILLSYPYERIQPFIQLLREAANHPAVASIRVTLYRVADRSRLIQYLMEAAENGKDVTVLMELRARFDEQNNIDWAERLEEAGCRVIYGTENYKVHSKICLITYRDRDNIRYITQIGTGNYHEKTVELYTDFSLITANDQIGNDAQEFFLNMSMGNLEGDYKALWVAPYSFKPNILNAIIEETEKAKAGKSCEIIMKCNSMTDKAVIKYLSEASEAGVPVRLIVRGICCILPGIKGKTEQIEVVSIVGRFLEHARVYSFGVGEDRKIYISSGDMMTRNTENRVEIACPVYNTALKKQLTDYLQTQLNDNVKAKELKSDGCYYPRITGKESINAQERFIIEAKTENKAEEK